MKLQTNKTAHDVRETDFTKTNECVSYVLKSHNHNPQTYLNCTGIKKCNTRKAALDNSCAIEGFTVGSYEFSSFNP